MTHYNILSMTHDRFQSQTGHYESSLFYSSLRENFIASVSVSASIWLHLLSLALRF